MYMEYTYVYTWRNRPKNVLPHFRCVRVLCMCVRVCVLPFFVYAQAKCVGCDTLSLRASERAKPKREREQMLQKSGESESESPVALMEYMNE